MENSEKVKSLHSRVRQLAAECKAMDVIIDYQDVAMTVLCGLLPKYEHLIVAIDAVVDDENLTIDFVKSLLLQEERRIAECEDVKPSVDSALINKQRESHRNRVIPVCTHCKRAYHTETNCWDKYALLKPTQGEGKESGMCAKVIPVDKNSDSDDDAVVCLMENVVDSSLARAYSVKWIIDSGATSHICNDRHMFSSLAKTNPTSVQLGDKSWVKTFVRGSVDVLLSVYGKPRRCNMKNVVYSPSMGYNMWSVQVMSLMGTIAVFDEHKFHVKKMDLTISHGLYYLTTFNEWNEEPGAQALVADLNLWHQRMANVNVDGIPSIDKDGVVEGVKFDPKPKLSRCKACVYGKISRPPVSEKRGLVHRRPLGLFIQMFADPFPHRQWEVRTTSCHLWTIGQGFHGCILSNTSRMCLIPSNPDSLRLRMFKMPL